MSKQIEQDIDKIVQSINDGVEVYKDFKDAKAEDSPGGVKIKISEVISIAVSNLGKAMNFFNSLSEIKDELVDLEAMEAPELVDALKSIYDPTNPYIDSGATKLITGILYLKEGIEDVVKAKTWEETA